MNALVSFRANAAGTLSPTPAERAKVTEVLISNARANLLGRIKNMRPVDATTTKQTSGGTGASQAELDRSAFLNLLMTQLQHQDPLEPVENTDMIAQLAQFSSLEQMTNLNSSFGALSGNIDQLNFISASGLVGRYVHGVDVGGEPVQGRVEGVQLDGSTVFLTVDGRMVSMAGVGQISEHPPEND